MFKKVKKRTRNSINFLNKNTGKPLNLIASGGRKKSKYNMFMKCEMKRLKTMPVNKSKKHSVVFKEAAKNWSKKK